ncbi:uncharacterized protein At3g27210-like isoform X2 [Andrographis paniculata]|uniref:uncharacterized protein At3g27210-like isoform X2 n=1 Tax=Andrographis paniculata TaxID=175694 RepID=UPI0021E8897D|nr:uncharacterized protein At3g27210-like isoform X2 [Andrographis paniculata]
MGGIEEEKFFDSHPWLESDCEDDFLSINGDFTPSAGTTPIHPQNPSAPPDQSPHSTDNNKRLLSELFQESSRNHPYITEGENASSREETTSEATAISLASHILKSRSCSNLEINNRTTTSTPNDRSSNGAAKAGDKTGMSVQCCLPRMMTSSRSFSERKKKSSPARSSRVAG